MKYLALFLFATISHALAEERFRFHHGEGITGIPTSVSDDKGAETLIRFSKDSNKTAIFVLNSLIDLEGVSGALKPQREDQGVLWNQAIVLIGAFTSTEKTTAAGPGLASQETY